MRNILAPGLHLQHSRTTLPRLLRKQPYQKAQDHGIALGPTRQKRPSLLASVMTQRSASDALQRMFKKSPSSKDVSVEPPRSPSPASASDSSKPSLRPRPSFLDLEEHIGLVYNLPEHNPDHRLSPDALRSRASLSLEPAGSSPTLGFSPDSMRLRTLSLRASQSLHASTADLASDMAARSDGPQAVDVPLAALGPSLLPVRTHYPSILIAFQMEPQHNAESDRPQTPILASSHRLVRGTYTSEPSHLTQIDPNGPSGRPGTPIRSPQYSILVRPPTPVRIATEVVTNMAARAAL
jgi:hypothetical protein